MFKKTIQVSLLNLIGFVVQFILNLFISSQFGLGLELDLYNKSISIPSYLIVLLSSCVSYIFVPLYTNIYKNKKNEAPIIINEYFIIVGAIALLSAFFAALFSNYFIIFFNRNNNENSISIIQNIFLIYCPIIFLSTVVEFLNSIFYANNKYKFPLFLKILNPLLLILLIYFLEKTSKNIAISYLITYTIQFLILFKFSNIFYFKFNLSIKLGNIFQKNKSLLSLSTPLLFSIILTKALPVFDVIFLSNFKDGIVSNILLAQKLINTISFLINSFFSVLFFSKISYFASEKDYDKLLEMLLMGIKSIFFISIPFIFYLMHNSNSIFEFLFMRDNFSSNNIKTLSQSFKFYLLGLPFIAIGSIIAYAVYSLQNLKIFYISSIIEVVGYISISIILKKYFFHNAIPIAYIINFIICDLLFFYFIVIQLRYKLKVKQKMNDLYKIITTSLIFVPYLIFTCNTSILLDSSIFFITLLLYIFILYKISFTPIIYIYKNIFQIEN